MSTKSSGRRDARACVAINMDFTLSGLSFRSFPGTYRFLSTQGSQDTVILRLEKPKYPQQWEVTVKDIANHGASGLPKEGIIMALKTCLLGSLKPPGHAESSDGGAPSGSVDIESGDGDSITLYLDIPFFGTMVTYTFGMQPVEREEVDILKAQLHDAQEEITILGIEVAELKRCKALQPVLISLRSSTECTEGQFVAWDTHEHNTDEGVFRRSEDTKTITVLQGGFFQVSVRLTDSSRGTHRKTSLFINGGEVAACHIGEANGYNKSATINDVFLLDNDANLQVHHTSNTPSNADVKTNNFTIIKL